MKWPFLKEFLNLQILKYGQSNKPAEIKNQISPENIFTDAMII